MSKTAATAAVGSLVYRPFKPMNPGRVVAIVLSNREDYNDKLIVKWKDGTTAAELRIHLMSFDGLIEEHKRKWQKFVAMARAL